MAILPTASPVRTPHAFRLAPALLFATGLLAFGCGRSGLYDFETVGNTGSGSSSGVVGPSACAEGDGMPQVLATGPNQIVGLAVDGASVYWLESQGDVMKVSKCGGTPTKLAAAGTAYGSSGGSTGLAVDATKAYWADDPGDMLTVSLSGGTPTTLSSNVPDVRGLTVNGGDVYWTTPSVVESLPIQGGASSTVAVSSSIAQGPPAADDTSVYWVGNGVFSVPRAGGAVATLAVTRGASTGLAIDDANVYWSDESAVTSPIMSTPKAGGASLKLADDQFGALGFAADGQYVYWTNQYGSVMKVPVAGGPPVTIASVPGPGPIVVDDTSVYWAQFTGTPTTSGNTGSVMRSPK